MRELRRSSESSRSSGENEERWLKRVYGYSRRAESLLQRLFTDNSEDENLSAARDHAKCLVWYLREARRNGGREEAEEGE